MTMNAESSQFHYVPLRRFSIVGVYAVPYPKRLLEAAGHRAMQDFAVEASLNRGIPDVKITADDVGDWTASLSLPDGAKCDCFLQQEVLSARASGVRDVPAALEIIEIFARSSFFALGTKYLRQLTLQFENGWAFPTGTPPRAVLDNSLLGYWADSRFGSFAQARTRPSRFASQLHWLLDEGEEAILAFEIPLAEALTITTSLGLQSPGPFLLESNPDGIATFLKRGFETYVESYEGVIAATLAPLGAVSIAEENK